MQKFNLGEKIYDGKFDLSKMLLLFYLVVSSGYIKELNSGQMKDLLENNRVAQHLVGFVTLIAIVKLCCETEEVSRILLYSVVGYLLFVFSTKIELHWNLAVVFLLVFIFLMGDRIARKNKEVDGDEHLTEEEKFRIKSKNNKLIKFSYLVLVIVEVIGLGGYFMKKRNQYGDGFDLDKFIFNARNLKNSN